ncbi:MAG: VOC family protein [Roseobacter sp.]
MPETVSVTLDYIEFSSPELEATETFFAESFGWSFINYGPDYRDIQNAGLGGGIERAPLRAPLPVLKTDNLEAMLERVRAAGGQITKEIFDFPGGRRFQFLEPGGTEMAVWTENN